MRRPLELRRELHPRRYGDTAVVEYFTSAAEQSNGHEDAAITTARGYTISGFSRGIPPKGYEAVCGGNDQSVPAKCYLNGVSLFNTLPLAYEKSKAVARLLINGTTLCTGWLVGIERHLISNYHCLGDPALATLTDFEFGTESVSCSVECKSVLGCQGPLMFSTSTFVASNEVYDYAIVKLPESTALTDYKYLQLCLSGPWRTSRSTFRNTRSAT